MFTVLMEQTILRSRYYYLLNLVNEQRSEQTVNNFTGGQKETHLNLSHKG
jgi:hypothetical protein